MMQYRLIHFVPDHLVGARFPIGAALSTGDGVQFVLSPRQPGPQCLGSERSAVILNLICRSLHALNSLEFLPATVGPHAVLDETIQLPASIQGSNAVNWLVNNVLAREEQPDEPKSAHHDGIQRATEGFGFFRKWNVQQYVKPRFRPQSHAREWPDEIAAPLPSVSHFVQGRGRLMLLEPIIASRSDFEDDAKKVGGVFMAYKGARVELPFAQQRGLKLIAYVIGGSDDRAMRGIVSRLGAAPDMVVDVDNPGRALAFASRIRRLGRTGPDPGLL